MNAPEAATRLVAIASLAEYSAPEVVPALARTILDEDDAVRSAAIAPLAAKRKRGALSHPAARGNASRQRATLPAVVASAVAGRLSPAAPKRAAPKRAAKPRATLAAAVASAVSRRLAAGRRTLRR